MMNGAAKLVKLNETGKVIAGKKRQGFFRKGERTSYSRDSVVRKPPIWKHEMIFPVHCTCTGTMYLKVHVQYWYGILNTRLV